MYRVRVELPRQLPRHLGDQAMQEMARAAGDGMLLVANRARENLRRGTTKTATLERSVTVEPVGVYGRLIRTGVGAGGQGAPYAAAVEFGSGIFSEAEGAPRQPYVIVPVNAKALAWPGGGAIAGGPLTRLSGNLRTSARRSLGADALVFRRRVVHPGVRPRPYLRPAVEAMAADLAALLAQAVDRVLRG